MTHAEFGRQAAAKVFATAASEEIQRMSDAPMRLLAPYHAMVDKYNQQHKENSNAQRTGQ